jgi:hypothetical protein
MLDTDESCAISLDTATSATSSSAVEGCSAAGASAGAGVAGDGGIPGVEGPPAEATGVEVEDEEGSVAAAGTAPVTADLNAAFRARAIRARPQPGTSQALESPVP